MFSFTTGCLVLLKLLDFVEQMFGEKELGNGVNSSRWKN
jgi:hypothetical protein